jgi:lysophospholipid acyltransferase (LPLAT)-like uncharacterized protein
LDKEQIISWPGAWVLRVVGWTLRIRITDHSGVLSGGHAEPVIFAYWHNRMLAVPFAYLRHYVPLVRSGRRKGAVVLISHNEDARLISAVMRRFGIGVVKGSSSRGGATALRELTECVRSGLDVNITPDGPRGPVYRLGSGLVFLAQTTSAPVLPIRVEYARCIRFKSWDGYMVPLPFSRIDMTLGPLERVAPDATGERFEAERLRIEKVMQPDTR